MPRVNPKKNIGKLAEFGETFSKNVLKKYLRETKIYFDCFHSGRKNKIDQKILNQYETLTREAFKNSLDTYRELCKLGVNFEGLSDVVREIFKDPFYSHEEAHEEIKGMYLSWLNKQREKHRKSLLVENTQEVIQ